MLIYQWLLSQISQLVACVLIEILIQSNNSCINNELWGKIYEF